MWGKGELPSRGTVRALEEAVIGGHEILARGLEAAGLRQERRALRLRVPDLEFGWLDHKTLRFTFSLPAGAYATTVLHELVAEVAAGGETP